VNPASKKRRLSITLPQPTAEETAGVIGWKSRYNLEARVKNYNIEVGDGATSRVYKGNLDGKAVAVKKLKHYSPRFSSTLIKCYQPTFHLEHENLVKVLGICPKSGLIVMEYCEKVIENCTVHTLNDVLLQLGNRIPIQLRLLALCDVAEGLSYLHSQGVVHGDIKPHNVLVVGENEGDYNFKITDYCGISAVSQASSRSSSFKQFMTPGYLAPELIGDVGKRLPPNKLSDIYSFGILSFEVYFCAEPWPNVSMQLLDAVRSGQRPIIPENASKGVKNVIQECWQQNSTLRPSASEIARLLQEQLETVVDMSDTMGDMSDTPASNVFSDVEASVQNSPSSRDDVYLSLSSDLSDMNEPVDTNHELQVANSSVCLENSISFANAAVHDSESSDHPVITDGATILNSFSFCDNELEHAKSILDITELKEFQFKCISSIREGKGFVVIQPTGSGKSACYTIPALLSCGKVAIIIEPLVAIITNQVDGLVTKGVDAVALGKIAGNNKSKNFHQVFHSTTNMPRLAFCTPEYLFGSPPKGGLSGSSGQFSRLLARSEYISLIAIDEAHKIFDRMPDYRPAFDALKQFRKMPCPIIAMSATLTSDQVEILQKEYMHDEECVVLSRSAHRSNLKLALRRYKRSKVSTFEDDVANESDDELDVDGQLIAASPWKSALEGIKPFIKDNSAVVYLDFVKDVNEVTELLRQEKFKVERYTGEMEVIDKQKAERKFLQGEVSVMVATEAYELGVDNPNIAKVVRIGCPRNLGVFLQEVGRAGRKPGSIAEGMLCFNEYIDDKRLGLWLRTALASESDNPAMAQKKVEMISMYVNVWHFIYSIYHGRCLSWGLAHFFSGDNAPHTTSCFSLNTPLCATCAEKELICQESVDIKEYIVLLLKTVAQLCDNGLDGVTKTLLIAVLLKCNQKYVLSFSELKDFTQQENTAWGCGTSVNGTAMSKSAWHKVLYVAVHLGYLEICFRFRPFDGHIEVHRRYCVTSTGKAFIVDPTAVVSVDPHSRVIDMLLGVISGPAHTSTHKRGTQLKPHIISAMEGPWTVGDIQSLRFLGSSTNSEDFFIKPVYFDDCFSIFTDMKDPHFLLQYIQFSRSQTAIHEMSFCLGGEQTTLMVNRSYCSGVKICPGENCHYAVSTKQRLNRCDQHPDMALALTGPCNCHLAYVYPKDAANDGRRWFLAISNEKGETFHNHPLPSEWKIPPHILKDIEQTVKRNVHISPKEIQQGVGMECSPMEQSLAAANLERIRTVVKKVRKDVDKVDNERVNPFKIIASFKHIKERIDGTNSCAANAEAIDKLVGKYQLEGDHAYCFGSERQYAFFQSPFQAFHWKSAEVLFVDIDYTGCHHFPYLFNVVCFNSVTSNYMACGRALLNRQDGLSIGRALCVLVENVKKKHSEYNISTAHKEILLDFDNAEANAFIDNFGMEVSNRLRGCEVHFLRSAMRVARKVNINPDGIGYTVFMSIVKRIPTETLRENVEKYLDVLCGLAPLGDLSQQILLDNCFITSCSQVDTTHWKDTLTWVEWWRNPRVLKKLSVAYSTLSSDDWFSLPSTTNPVESINRQSVPQNHKTVSLKPLVEHIYLEDRRQAILEVAMNANVTISYSSKKKRRNYRARKTVKQSSFGDVPVGKRAVGLRVSIEFLNEGDEGTTWYKGTVISYSRRGYIVSFDGCGPEDNEVVKSLKKAMDMGELKIL